MISRSSTTDTDEPLAEINVTPLVDVMLVLVVILLVIAPLLTRTIRIDLPKVTASASESRTHSVTVSLDADGRIFFDGSEIALSNSSRRSGAARCRTSEPLSIYVLIKMNRSARSRTCWPESAMRGSNMWLW